EKAYRVDSLHGDKNQCDRQTALNKFKNGYAKILIATDVAARGIDISGVNLVI
ncbi:MAG: ATP-dependent helicase, partial [Flavobacteriales bacterium]|nr:ATP-dependent helicase [Flavobacteriales bacterium]